jgi:hypothetical protein
LLEVNSKFCLRYSVETACKNTASTYFKLFRLSNDQWKIPPKFLFTCDCSDCRLLWSIKVPSKGKILSSPKCAIQLWEPTATYLMSSLCSFFRRKSSRNGKLITHLNLIPTLRKHEATPPLPHMPSWRAQWLLSFFVYILATVNLC